MAAALLGTKLYLPPVRPTLVPRPRLVTRFDEGLKRPLTLISAPAGFGKTTLVSEWRAGVTGRDYPLAWLALDEEDNDPTRFLTYLISALGALRSGLGEAALGMLQSPQPPPLSATLTGLVNELGEIERPFALVLDDYHFIRAQPVHDALTFLLENLPQRMHIVLLTRADPPLALARMRAHDQLVEIRVDSLRFTPSEVAAFFSDGMGLELSARDMAALGQRTEGWIAGLQLAALALKQPGSMQGVEDSAEFVASFAGSHHYVADYLTAEVLSRQPETVRSFLLQTSILDRMTGELCDWLTGYTGGQAMLKELEQANLFLVSMDAERLWYRYHHLFADMLRNQLRHTYSDQVSGLHLRAAEWYERHGFVSEAMNHSLAAGDEQRAARLLEENAMAMLMRGDAVTVSSWINSIAPLVEEGLWLSIYQAWMFICTGRLDQLETPLQRVERRIGPQVPVAEAEAMRFHIAAVRMLAASRRGDAEKAIDLANTVLDRLPEADPRVGCIVVYTLGEASRSIGELAEAGRAFAEAARMAKEAGNLHVAVTSLSWFAGLLSEQGELHRAAETYREALLIAARHDGRMEPAAARACLGLGRLEFEWNDLEAASRRTDQAIELGRRMANPDHMASTRLLQARLQYARGATADALDMLRQAEDLGRERSVMYATRLHIDAFHVRLWLAQANLDAAERWARQKALSPQDEVSYPHQIAYFALARILIGQGQLETALALTKRLLTLVEKHGLMGRALEVLLLQSLALDARGDIPRALSVVGKALTLAESENYRRVFLDEGAPMAELLRRAGSHGIAPKYVARLLSEFNRGVADETARKQPLIEPLTDREMEVLRLVAKGLSNQAIAGQLVLAVGTVKTHTASLYRKLDVASRTQAVVRATELGLL